MSAADSTAEAHEAGPGVPDKLKFATKTALSLTLAYLLPMALGWPQPQTAAITVMLIAATGSLSESMQKGVLRTIGTVAGAAIGLTLIAVFPQDRLAYLAAVSVLVTIILYLYNAYQGDSTVFMLTMVVTLMVFNGGDADGAFIYGIDRTLLTVFGVLTYSLVGSFLWPVKINNNLQQLAAAVSLASLRTGALFAREETAEVRSESEAEALEALLHNLDEFRTHYVAVRHDADRVQAYQSEWNTILACYERLESITVPALRSNSELRDDSARLISNFDQVTDNLQQMLENLQTCWKADSPPAALSPIKAHYDDDLLQRQKHLVIAAVISRSELLDELQELLQQLVGAVGSMRFQSGDFRRDMEIVGTPSFVWFDQENLKTALRGFVTFWIATFIWIQYNPPGGFMFVTLCTALVPLVSYTPVTPKLLIFLFSFGFMFALPAYVFLLPGMTHWLQLALFLFGYAFIGFFLFPGPVAIFFLLGLFALGIQNDMYYNFNGMLLVVLMFYMVCALLIISVQFPFSSKPEVLYLSFRRRYLHLCAKIIRTGPPATALDRVVNRVRMTTATSLVAKMQQWGAMIDNNYYPGSSAKHIIAFNHSCENLLGRLRALTGPRNPYANNHIIQNARRGKPIGLAAALCDTLAYGEDPLEIDREFNAVRQDLQLLEEQLHAFLDQNAPDEGQAYDQKAMAEFYVFINLQASILTSIDQCKDALQALDWRQLRETRF